MKNLAITLIAVAIFACTAQAQRDNLYVHNDSDPNYGCSYYITPIGAIGLFGIPVIVTGLRTEFDPEDAVTFTLTQLTDILGLSYQYIGAKVEIYNGESPLYVGDYPGVYWLVLEDSNDAGDCGGEQVDAYYDENHVYQETAEVYVIDMQ